MKALPTKFGQVAQTKNEKGGVDAEGRDTPCDGGKQRHGRKRYGGAVFGGSVVLRLLFIVVQLVVQLVVNFFCVEFIFLSIATGKRLTREEFKARGNRMQRGGQANAVPLGPFKNNNGYANKAMPLMGSPAPFV